MIRNYYYLIVGLLCIVFAVTHTLNGIQNVLPVLEQVGIKNSEKTIFTYVWHTIGVENLIFGIALLIMTFRRNLSKVKFTAWLIMAILFARWMTITSFSVLNDSDSTNQLIPDSIAIFVIIALLWLGTKQKYKLPDT